MTHNRLGHRFQRRLDVPVWLERGPQGAFSPADIDGLIVWFEADVITGLADTDPVSTWPDQSLNNYDASAAGANRPLYQINILNGLPVVRFDGVNDRMDTIAFPVALTQPFTYFVVANIKNLEDDWACVVGSISGVVGNRMEILSRAPSAPDEFDLFAGVEYLPGHDTPKNTWATIMILWDGASSEMWLDGAIGTTGNVGGNVLPGIRLGDDGFPLTPLDGDLYAVLAYDNDIGSSARASVEAYLNAKTGL